MSVPIDNIKKVAGGYYQENVNNKTPGEYSIAFKKLNRTKKKPSDERYGPFIQFFRYVLLLLF